MLGREFSQNCHATLSPCVAQHTNARRLHDDALNDSQHDMLWPTASARTDLLWSVLLYDSFLLLFRRDNGTMKGKW